MPKKIVSAIITPVKSLKWFVVLNKEKNYTYITNRSDDDIVLNSNEEVIYKNSNKDETIIWKLSHDIAIKDKIIDELKREISSGELKHQQEMLEKEKIELLQLLAKASQLLPLTFIPVELLSQEMRDEIYKWFNEYKILQK